MDEITKAREIAKAAWKNSKEKGKAYRKCLNCFEKWKRNDGKEEGRPPIFPLKYGEKCPICGQELSHPLISF